MVTVGGATLVYDGENRLVQDGATSFVYGPDGSRLKKMAAVLEVTAYHWTAPSA
jgi:hypothetical protein